MPVIIDPHKCTGCGLCMYECGSLVFDFDPMAFKAVVAYNQLCVDCFICQETCPEGAITVKLRQIRPREQEPAAGAAASRGAGEG